MNVCVLMKQIPDPVSSLNVRADGLWIDESNIVYTTNESDSYALEEALLLKEKGGGEVVVVTAGPERSLQLLKDALAKGADRAIHITPDPTAPLDALGMAQLLSTTLKTETFDLILTGLQSDDTGDGQLGPMIAEKLDIPHVTLVVSTDVTGETIKVKQELEGGWFQNATVSLPALLTIQSGINKPRYASLRGIMAMKSKEIKTVTPGDIGLSTEELAPAQSLTKLYVPEKTKKTIFLEGSTQEIVTQLIDKLTNDAKVI